MIKNAIYTSVWDGGFEVSCDCKVNMVTKEVFEIVGTDIDWVEILEDEYIIIDGKKYPVSRDREDDTEYWYS